MSDSSKQAHEGGVVVRGADGSLYFLRDHVLAQSKMSPELSKNAEKLLAEPNTDAHNFKVAKAAPDFKVLGRIDGNIGSSAKLQENMRAVSTVMCPSFLFSRSGPITERNE